MCLLITRFKRFLNLSVIHTKVNLKLHIDKITFAQGKLAGLCNSSRVMGTEERLAFSFELVN